MDKSVLYKENPVYEWFKIKNDKRVVFKVDPVKPEGWSVSGHHGVRHEVGFMPLSQTLPHCSVQTFLILFHLLWFQERLKRRKKKFIMSPFLAIVFSFWKSLHETEITLAKNDWRPKTLFLCQRLKCEQFQHWFVYFSIKSMSKLNS